MIKLIVERDDTTSPHAPYHYRIVEDDKLVHWTPGFRTEADAMAAGEKWLEQHLPDAIEASQE